ncbi:YfgM family protein [Roseateles saccharophilus]|uniref:Ancillary SecYEG translocon subunit n=1 Tax=Roseateles saccharophilus TaxID=304 RepID=A0A4R3UIX0_ROSSA|nr:tetratricopeptide repeat protein [Roseateles saccharophilus]MDG0833808.1 tetratricopeptide repeat protein [Roseateles saccharophilus]TCU91566.1 putative negative regulator of RcsB-dependent stress response [Roseateles saccharophilus]
MASHLDLEEQEQLEQVKAFWKRWGNLITWVLTAALAAFAGWQGWNWYQRDQAAKAGAMYDEFDRALNAQDLDKATAAAGDLKARFAGTGYAAQASLQVARLQLDKGKADDAKQSLAWVAEQGSEPPYRDLARLRLAGLQLDAKAYDEALKTLDAIKSPEFAALVADRRGDALLLQDKRDAAKAEYQKALAGIEKTQNYRSVIEAKLATLGVPTVVEAAAAGAMQ